MVDTRKTAIVTGASRGIRAGLVEAFLKRGYNVVANSRHITEAKPFAASPNLALVDGDIGDPSTATKIVDTAVSRFGRIDVLINNAGVLIPKPFTEYTTEDFNILVSTTLAGFLYVTLYRQALKGTRDNQTAITNVFTGRPARAIVNRFMREVGPMSDVAPEFPLAAATLAPLRAKSEMAGSTDFTPFWSGQAVRLGRELPAAELTKQLAAETLGNLRLLQTIA